MQQIQTNFKEFSADFVQNIDIEETNFTIRLTYNIRDEAFFMTINTENNIIRGIKLVINHPLIEPYRAWLPELKGDFIILPIQEEKSTSFIFEDLNIYYDLFYMTETELAEWKAFYGIR